ncbi:porin, partial [Candidatus Roizmanbacteria bacterium]|nr:porin [Candidatus Roizmanbacteria bacterium]
MLNAWVEYNLIKATKEDPNSLTAGAGYHYWNGISRMAMTSTINLLTLDIVNPLPNQLNGTGQFGYFLKGNIDKFGYDLAFNEPVSNSAGTPVTPATTAKFNANNTKWAYTGYVHYQFGDAESMFLPYRVGSYVGTKSIFNIGAGAYYNPGASVQLDGSGNLEKKDHTIISADIFFDQPIGTDLALT